MTPTWADLFDRAAERETSLEAIREALERERETNAPETGGEANATEPGRETDSAEADRGTGATEDDDA